ncbi:Small auxin-up RNA [Arabidopsis suecica]|uniref:Small auxin-up RNA n=1 Tax=Arabidopsis suecica TaxID=45249 RepID=A0A8T2A3E4_ARASU|nr:Small auxin-up RNA [Arabidopsis suecica]
MRRLRGIKIRRPVQRISRWILRRIRIRRSRYTRLSPNRPVCKPRAITKLISWGRSLTSHSARFLGSKCSNSGYIPIGQEPIRQKPDPVPKGHSAVYIGKKDGDFQRVLVPIVYFNHPLFGELLREAEEEFGFCQEGGITIPCPYSDFKRVQTRIESGSGFCKLPWSRRRQ